MKKFLIYAALFIGLVIVCYIFFGNKGLLAGLLPGLLVFNRKDAVLEYKEKELKEEIDQINKELKEHKKKLSDKEIEDYFNE